MKEALDELYLLNRDEKPLSQKAAAILAGITSFGAIFPIFFSNFHKVFGEKDPFTIFKIFVGIYFLVPLVTLLIWIYFSRDKKIHVNEELDKTVKETREWLMISLVVQLVLGFFMIIIQRNRIDVSIALWWSIAYAVVAIGLIVLLIKRVKNDRATWIRWLVVPALLLAFLVLIIPHYSKSGKDEKVKVDQRANSKKKIKEKASADRYGAYNEIAALYDLDDNVKSVQNQTLGLSERYRMRSHLRWAMDNTSDDLNKAFKKMTESDLCFKKHLIKPYIDFFEVLIFSSNDTKDLGFDTIIKNQHFVTDPNFENSTFFFNIKEAYDAFSKKAYDSVTHELKDSSAFVAVIDSILSKSFENKSLVVHPDKNSLTKDNDSALFMLFKSVGLVDSETHVVPAETVRKFNDYLNEINSYQLNLWVRDFIAYIQRRSQDQGQDTLRTATWVFKDAQIEGLLVFGVFFITLIIYYVVVSAQNNKLREQAIDKIESLQKPKPSTEANTDAAQDQTQQKQIDAEVTTPKEDIDQTKKNLDLSLKLIQFHLFPAITFLGIILALLIPLCKPIKSDDIQLSRPDWFLAIPNWNVASATKSAVTETNCNCNTAQPTTPGKNAPSKYPPLNMSELATHDDVEKVGVKTDSLWEDVKAINGAVENTNAFYK